MRRRLLLPTLLAALLAAALGPLAVLANGVPQLVKLTYLDGLSNYGPQDAEGVLEFSFAEAYAKLDAQKLAAPPAGHVYEGWLVKTATNESVSIGTFTPDAAGTVHYETALPPIQDYGFDLFVITLEPNTADGVPSQQRSIAGYFTVVNRSAPAVQNRPDTLPYTGGGDVLAAVARLGLVGGAAFVGLVAAVGLARRRRTA
ncbi:MAG TPA: anti-sigma factor [Dehalococcoidia bacterium]